MKKDYSIYDYEANSIDGELVQLSNYKGKKIIIVNVASKCGYTYQYKGLQELYEKYKDKVEILAFPSNDFLWQEPGKNSSIKTFCSTNYGVEFPLFEKIVVKKKKNQHPIYTWLSNKNTLLSSNLPVMLTGKSLILPVVLKCCCLENCIT